MLVSNSTPIMLMVPYLPPTKLQITPQFICRYEGLNGKWSILKYDLELDCDSVLMIRNPHVRI